VEAGAEEDRRASPGECEVSQILGKNDGEGIPLYLQLRRIIRDKIITGEFKSDEQIPPEVEICREYGVSRITVRKAIESLIQEDLLRTRQGKGTFVTPRKLSRRLPFLYSFTDDMHQLGLEPSSTVVAFELQRASPADEATLKLPSRDPHVFCLTRVRRANNEPILLENTLIPHNLCPQLLTEDLENDSLYRVLTETYRLPVYDAEESYEAGLATAENASLLNCRPGAPVFLIRRLANLEDGTPFELTRSVGRGDCLQFSLHLAANPSDRFIRRHVDVAD